MDNKEISINGESSLQINCGEFDREVYAKYADMDKKQTVKFLFEKDPTLWKTEPDQVKEISQCLGWLALPDSFLANTANIQKFAVQIKSEGYKAIVLLGMGGSSLSSEVARKTFGAGETYPQLFILDNTDPDAIGELEKKITLDKTLFIVASKSGDTKETLSFFRYFYEQVENTRMNSPGNNFVAITDDGTPLVKMAEYYKFRKVFLNPSDLGGRYSVLSYFGLVPMVLTGIDINSFLQGAKDMMDACEKLPPSLNPGISLGVVLGICQKHGRDKVTFILSSSISSLGYWLEQLLAESTGKDALGLIPVNGEILGHPDVYDKDRVFIHMYLSIDNNYADDIKINALEQARHPVIRIKLTDKMALGGEYYRWEIATAIAGIVIGINPFNQPDVQESKDNTEKLLKEWHKKNSFEDCTPLLSAGNIDVYVGDEANGLMVDEQTSPGDLTNRFTALACPGDYIAILPYFLITEHRSLLLQEWRKQVRDRSKNATTLLNGPRYLHSTGQLHKGGQNTGLFILLTGGEGKNLAIPGQNFGFGTLQIAQALGDFHSLDEKGRRVIRIHLGKNIDGGLNKLYQSILESNAKNLNTN